MKNLFLESLTGRNNILFDITERDAPHCFGAMFASLYMSLSYLFFLREACLPKRKPAQLQAGIIVKSPECLFCQTE
jgi:hypothetical protein